MALLMERQSLGVKGSAQTVSTFLDVAVNSICFLRNLAPEESFNLETFHGMKVWRSSDKTLSQYITTSLADVKGWLESCHIEYLKMVIKKDSNDEVVEIWKFDIANSQEGHKDQLEGEQLKKSMKGLMKQIMVFINSLPNRTDSCSMRFEGQTSPGAADYGWTPCKAAEVEGGEVQKFKTFATQYHKILASVDFKE